MTGTGADSATHLNGFYSLPPPLSPRLINIFQITIADQKPGTAKAREGISRMPSRAYSLAGPLVLKQQGGASFLWFDNSLSSSFESPPQEETLLLRVGRARPPARLLSG